MGAISEMSFVSEPAAIIPLGEIEMPQPDVESESISFASTDDYVGGVEAPEFDFTPIEPEFIEGNSTSEVDKEEDNLDMEDVEFPETNESYASGDYGSIQTESGEGQGSGGRGQYSAPVDDPLVTNRLAKAELTSNGDNRNDGWTNLPPDLPPDISLFITPVIDQVVQGTTFTITTQDVSPNLPFFKKGTPNSGERDPRSQILFFNNPRNFKAVTEDFRSEGNIASAA